MASFWDRINPIGKKSWVNPIANKSYRNAVSDFLTGSPEKHERVSTLRPEQEPGFNQLQGAVAGPGAGGAYGDAADYYRDLLSNDSQTAQQMFAPEQRRFNEEIIPGLSEQFAGMGAGGLSSSGFQNAAVNAGTDLSERLGAIRANLRSQGAQGLMNIGQQGLGNYSQDVMTQPGTQGFLSQVAPAVGQAVTAYATGGLSPKGLGPAPVGRNSSPYGNQNMSSGNQNMSSGNFQLPNFNMNRR